MSLITIRADDLCDNGRTCPHVSATSQGTLIVQGYLVSDPALAAGIEVPAGEIAIEVPLALLPELASDAGTLYLTDRSTVMFLGTAVSDPSALAELTIPPGEAAIEVPADVLPFLEVAGRA